MYMEKIVAAEPSSALARRLVGVPVLLVSGAVMVPWLAMCGLVSGVALGARALVAAPRTMVTLVDHAGRVALGR